MTQNENESAGAESLSGAPFDLHDTATFREAGVEIGDKLQGAGVGSRRTFDALLVDWLTDGHGQRTGVRLFVREWHPVMSDRVAGMYEVPSKYFHADEGILTDLPFSWAHIQRFRLVPQPIGTRRGGKTGEIVPGTPMDVTMCVMADERQSPGVVAKCATLLDWTRDDVGNRDGFRAYVPTSHDGTPRSTTVPGIGRGLGGYIARISFADVAACAISPEPRL